MLLLRGALYVKRFSKVIDLEGSWKIEFAMSMSRIYNELSFVKAINQLNNIKKDMNFRI